MDTPPRLLLDTNILVDLAQGKLAQHEGRLRTVATSDARLVWLPEVAVLELMAPLLDASPARFDELVSALRWADELAGNRLAEGYDYALRVGAATTAVDRNGERRIAMNQARRRLIKVKDRSMLSTELVTVLEFMRDVRERQRSEWVTRLSVLKGRLARSAKEDTPEADVLEGQAIVDRIIKIAGESIVGIAERHSDEHGPSRTVEEVTSNLREFLYFDAAVLSKGLGPNGYSHDRHRTDFHDWVLCSYPALGYTVVTGDKRLLNSLKMTKCPSPRIVDVDAGLRMAEGWLANRALNLTGADAPAG